MESESPEIKLSKAVSIFVIATLYFYILLFTLLPYLQSHVEMNPAMYWFITGYFLFIPIFLYPLVAAWKEGHRTLPEIANALNIKPMLKKDIRYAVGATVLIFVLSGLIFGISLVLNKHFGIKPLNTTPWFMELHPFQGKEKLLLFVWLPMFCFNILGEELLWRGYIQTRLQGKFAWFACSILWMLFHLPFGIDLLITLAPIIVLLPYAYHKTKNTMVSILIHAIYNGPIFILISLGVMN